MSVSPVRYRVALVVSFLALLIALGAAGTALWAAGRAQTAVAAAVADSSDTSDPSGQGTPAVGDEPQPEPVATTADTSGFAPEEPIDPEADFALRYEKRALKLQTPQGCCSSRNLDLDEPRAGAADEDAEVLVSVGSAGGSQVLQFSDGTQAAKAEATATPNQCAEQIQFSPLAGGDESYVARKADSYCVLTSKAQAVARGDTQQMVLLTITGLTDEMLTVEATAFVVPE